MGGGFWELGSNPRQQSSNKSVWFPRLCRAGSRRRFLNKCSRGWGPGWMRSRASSILGAKGAAHSKAGPGARAWRARAGRWGPQWGRNAGWGGCREGQARPQTSSGCSPALRPRFLPEKTTESEPGGVGPGGPCLRPPPSPGSPACGRVLGGGTGLGGFYGFWPEGKGAAGPQRPWCWVAAGRGGPLSPHRPFLPQVPCTSGQTLREAVSRQRPPQSAPSI